MDTITHANELIEKGIAFCLATVVTSSLETVSAGQKAIVPADGNICGSFGFDPIDQYVCTQALKHMRQKKSGTARFEDGAEFFFNVIASETRLLICGAGHIAIPLAQFAVRTGFQVTVLDDRSDFADPKRFPGCRVIAEAFTPALKDMELGPEAFVVVITRGHEHDSECLQALLQKDSAYIGLIGSRRRVRFVLEMLQDDGIPAQRLNEIFTPIGIPIGAESPVEIALSIASELVCVRRKGWQQARALRAAVGIDK